MIQYKDIAHLYLECKIIHTSSGLISIRKSLQEGLTSYEEWKPALRRIEDITEKDFYSFGKLLLQDGQELITATLYNNWCFTCADSSDVIIQKTELEKNDSDIIYEAEEADYDNVISYSKTSGMHHGTGSGDMMYFCDIKLQSSFIAYLLKNNFDLFDLIKSGQAIDAKILNITYA